MSAPIDPIYADVALEDFDNLSICLDCAKHPSLKRYIDMHGTVGPVCGVCHFREHPYRCCDLGHKTSLINVLKALIRLHYNEFDYNRHWGADLEPEELLSQENPILEHTPTADRTRSPEQSEGFLRDLFSQLPYPDPADGLSLYAGHDEHIGRMLQLSLKDSISPELESFQARLANENYYDVEPHVRTLIENLAERMTQSISKGTRFFRARIGVEARFLDHEAPGLLLPLVRQPFSGKSLGAPPPQITGAGRLNRSGVSFLYVASDAVTAACEVRPHPGHYFSIGEFECDRDLKIAAFDLDIVDFAQSEADLRLFHFLISAESAFATPITPEEARRYSITQLIADCIRQCGFDGVAFKSSVSKGQNLCVFAPQSLKFIEGSATAKYVEALSYRLASAASISIPTGRYSRIQ
jgi:RES domain